MKKFFTLAAIAFAAIAMVSCEKEGNKNNGNEGEDVVARKVLMHLASELTEDAEFLYGRSFEYDANGKLSAVNEIGDWGSYNLTVTWNGNKVTFTEDGGEVAYEWTLNDKGYVVAQGDYTYEYDAEGHLTKITEDWGEGPYVASIITWENGNMTSWSKEGENEDGSARVKRQTYKTDLNKAGIFTAFTEKSSLKKWMFELGFFGVASKNLVATDKWDDRESGADFEYRFDADGYVVAEVKYWEGEVDDETYYIWQPAK